MIEGNRGKAQSKCQVPSLLDEVLERRMLLYALAAGATLAGTSAAQAKVVFTPSNAVLKASFNGDLLPIDLNHDGVNDFTVTDKIGTFSFTYYMYARGDQQGNLIANQPQNFQGALRRGNRIGSGATFLNDGVMAEDSAGPFWNTTNRFLGVKFLINGQVHYGWIGFRSVLGNLTATLGGWAYETEPNKSIIAGDKGGGDADSDSDSAALTMREPTSLELLAMGHTAIADRQRRIAAQAKS